MIADMGHVASIKEKRNAYENVIEKPKGRKLDRCNSLYNGAKY
jgi:hypothetical protein